MNRGSEDLPVAKATLEIKVIKVIKVSAALEDLQVVKVLQEIKA